MLYILFFPSHFDIPPITNPATPSAMTFPLLIYFILLLVIGNGELSLTELGSSGMNRPCPLDKTYTVMMSPASSLTSLTTFPS